MNKIEDIAVWLGLRDEKPRPRVYDEDGDEVDYCRTEEDFDRVCESLWHGRGLYGCRKPGMLKW